LTGFRYRPASLFRLDLPPESIVVVFDEHYIIRDKQQKVLDEIKHGNEVIKTASC
jgi:hypothetical protein